MASKTAVYRIQSAEGRGPFQPGLTRRWLQPRPDHALLVPWMDEFGMERVLASVTPGRHVGCACMSLEGLRRWFSGQEYLTLLRMGFAAVRLEVDRVVAQSEIQVVFERRRPLKEGARVLRLYEPGMH